MAFALVLEIAHFPGIGNTVKTGQMVVGHIAEVERIPHRRTNHDLVGNVFDEKLEKERVRVGVEHADFVFECVLEERVESVHL